LALELKQSLKMSQQLVMTPQLQQAIKLLQLSRMELTELVREEMMENPLLEEQSEQDLEAGAREASGPTVDDVSDRQELQPRDGEVVEAVTDPKAEKAHEEIDWEGYLENYQHLGPTAGAGIRPDSDELPGVEQTLTRSATLFEHLIWQVRLSTFTDEEAEAASFIIGNLDDDGYFKIDSDTGDPLIRCATATGVSLTVAERALRKVQTLDPIGIAARDLQECLLIQARAMGEDDTLVGEIIRHYMKQVETRNPQAIAKALDVSVTAIIQAIQIIQEMEPRPGRQYTGADPQYITPDVYVHKVGDKFVTVLNDDGLSKLRISSAYRSVLVNGKSGDAKEYIKERLRSAQWLIRSIHQRQRTIYKVTDSIVKYQQEFFEKGVAHLKPLILRQVAEDIGMHESTVSRVTSNKYVHTPQGIYELKFFFNSAISSTSGDDLASQAVKSKIQKLVSAEDVKKPYSDQKIVELLATQGIEIARRTVAKYRDQLGILPSSKRKRLY
jgi:RNA polymerase sigma-54 factor